MELYLILSRSAQNNIPPFGEERKALSKRYECGIKVRHTIAVKRRRRLRRGTRWRWSRDRKVTRGKVHLAHHPHNAVSRIPILKVKDRSPDIKNVIHMDKACAYKRRADAMIAHSRGLIQPTMQHIRTATAKTRGKPVSVPRETCTFSRIAKLERKVRNLVADLGHQGLYVQMK